MSSFREAIAAQPVVLDGGLGTLLEARGHDLSSSLWSARLLLEEPASIRRAHAEFFAAGARVAITSSYQVSYDGFAALGVDRGAVDGLLARTVRLAREARDEAGLDAGDAWVAASVGPYGASRADGSEYTGEYGLSVSELREWHRPRLEALAAAEPDLLAVETLPSLAEVEAVALELRALRIPAWVSVTPADGSLRTGESLAEAFAIAGSVDDVVAVGVNCCAASEVAAALHVAGEATGKPGIAYPNSGELWHADTRSWSGVPHEIAGSTTEWLAGGARAIGGCCRVGADQIARLARALGDDGRLSVAPPIPRG
ncbi:MAG: homocysteine S-methyltransferase [Microbacterium sp.]